MVAQRSLHQPCCDYRAGGKASDESKDQEDRSAVELTIDPVSEECSTEIRDEEADADLREEGEIRTRKISPTQCGDERAAGIGEEGKWLTACRLCQTENGNGNGRYHHHQQQLPTLWSINLGSNA